MSSIVSAVRNNDVAAVRRILQNRNANVNEKDGVSTDKMGDEMIADMYARTISMSYNPVVCFAVYRISPTCQSYTV
jgi:glutamine synthetase type III